MKNKVEQFLPIGSLVRIDNKLKRVMIIGFGMRNIKNPKKIYDYIGCIYPDGLLTTREYFLFDHENIIEVCVKGYSDQEERDFKVDLKEKYSKIEVK